MVVQALRDRGLSDHLQTLAQDIYDASEALMNPQSPQNYGMQTEYILFDLIVDAARLAWDYVSQKPDSKCNLVALIVPQVNPQYMVRRSGWQVSWGTR